MGEIDALPAQLMCQQWDNFVIGGNWQLERINSNPDSQLSYVTLNESFNQV